MSNAQDNYLKIGDILLSQDRFEEGLAFYQLAIDFEVDNLDVLLHIVDILKQKLALDQAIIFIESALENHQDYRLFHQLGLIYLEKGNLDEAISYLRQAVEVNPNSYWLYHDLGDALAIRNGSQKS